MDLLNQTDYESKWLNLCILLRDMIYSSREEIFNNEAFIILSNPTTNFAKKIILTGNYESDIDKRCIILATTLTMILHLFSLKNGTL